MEDSRIREFITMNRSNTPKDTADYGNVTFVLDQLEAMLTQSVDIGESSCHGVWTEREIYWFNCYMENTRKLIEFCELMKKPNEGELE